MDCRLVGDLALCWHPRARPAQRAWASSSRSASSHAALEPQVVISLRPGPESSVPLSSLAWTGWEVAMVTSLSRVSELGCSRYHASVGSHAVCPFGSGLFLRVMLSRFIQAAACVGTPLLFLSEEYSTVWVEQTLCIHSFVHGHLRRFPPLAIVHNAAVNVGVRGSV